jgi:malonyl CoA-acyl carrier protein transacylase
MATSVLDKHRQQLELHETMMGHSRGRLAVALDLLTDALALVGQHGVYCQSARRPGRPALDLSLVLEQIGDAKELVQVVIESDGQRGVRPLDPGTS